MQTLDDGRIEVASQAVGIAQAALDESIKYAKERVQFGKPISAQQAIQWMIADMATDISAARFLTYHAAYLKDQGESYSKEAAMAKVFASEMATRHTSRQFKFMVVTDILRAKGRKTNAGREDY